MGLDFSGALCEGEFFRPGSFSPAARESSFGFGDARQGITYKRRFIANVADQHQDGRFTQFLERVARSW